jgi:phosphoribosylformylglycinamidine synthase
MPHPEHAIDPLTGPTDDGLGLFFSVQDLIGAASRVGA